MRNANNDAQVVLVVQNSGTKAAVIRGVIDTYIDGHYFGSIACKESTLNPGFTRGCFDITLSGTSTLRGETTLFMNGDQESNVSTDSWEG
ncbi:hypothetical protein FNH09_32745 [Streptomyces adustus]|uniref:Uncharacterized protein n=1 Tax=Streptomyces adustus TaxID=1609272 RepID=A0A5N8VKP7_9ACTN|nr:hypothetical protein [Streptomyces adustus]MPY35830.1 hypothetical protein [Streptomyces adustus]